MKPSEKSNLSSSAPKTLTEDDIKLKILLNKLQESLETNKQKLNRRTAEYMMEVDEEDICFDSFTMNSYESLINRIKTLENRINDIKNGANEITNEDASANHEKVKNGDALRSMIAGLPEVSFDYLHNKNKSLIEIEIPKAQEEYENIIHKNNELRMKIEKMRSMVST